MLEGTVTLKHDKPEVTGFDSSEEYYADSYIPSQTLSGQNHLVDMEHENAFCQFKEYRTVSAQYVTLDGVPLAPSVNAQVNYTILMTIKTSNGNLFKNNLINTALTATLWRGGKEIDTDGSQFSYIWTKTDADGIVDTIWNQKHHIVTGKQIGRAHV